MLRAAICVESFRCTGVILLQWQGENFAHQEHLKFCHSQPVHGASKNPISPKVLTDFRNLCLSSKMLRVGILVESFRCAGNLPLEWQSENSALRQHLKFCKFQPVQGACKNPISPKVFNRFSKSLPQLEDVEGGNLGGKFQVHRDFTFAMAMWKLCALTTFEILQLSTCALCQQKSHISKGIQPIFEIFSSARRCWEWAFGWKFSGVQVFYFCNARWKLCAWTIFEILPLSTCILGQQKSYLSKDT